MTKPRLLLADDHIENLHWISYDTASASMNSSPDAPACSAVARTAPKLSLG
jgi:hypothetical protein